MVCLTDIKVYMYVLVKQIGMTNVKKNNLHALLLSSYEFN